MALVKCPRPEALLEYVTISSELNLVTRLFLKGHLLSCAPCRESVARLEANWKRFFMPETDITLSLMRVFSRLKKDETLILKGWKLDQAKSREFAVKNWLFRGAISLGVLGLAVATLPQLLKGKSDRAQTRLQKLPVAQFRFEDRNGVRVQYFRPELLESIEFRTTSGGR